MRQPRDHPDGKLPHGTSKNQLYIGVGVDDSSRSTFIHEGSDRSQIQGYLDLLYVAMNEPEDTLEKVAMVLDRAMRCRKTLRFREFYKKKSSSCE